VNVHTFLLQKTDLEYHQNNACNLQKFSPDNNELETCNKEKKSFCPCNQTNAKTSSGLAAHINKYHYNTLSQNFFCYKCFLEFDFAIDVVKHLSKDHHLFEIKKSQLIPSIQQFFNNDEINNVSSQF